MLRFGAWRRSGACATWLRHGNNRVESDLRDGTQRDWPAPPAQQGDGPTDCQPPASAEEEDADLPQRPCRQWPTWMASTAP